MTVIMLSYAKVFMNTVKGKFDTPDGALLTFQSDDPKYSFVQFDEYGNVIRTVEKRSN